MSSALRQLPFELPNATAEATPGRYVMASLSKFASQSSRCFMSPPQYLCHVPRGYSCSPPVEMQTWSYGLLATT